MIRLDMTDNPQAIDKGRPVAVVEHITSPWENLREQARQTREAVGSMDTVSAFAYCVDNFLNFTDGATKVNPDIQGAVGDFKEVVAYLAERVTNDDLMIVSIPGKDIKKVGIFRQNDNTMALRERLQIHLREHSWLKVDNRVIEEGLRTSLLHVLAASFGVDPGPIESIRPLAEISSKTMRGDFNDTSPPIPFSKSVHAESELQIETAVPGINIVLDQNSQLYLCLEPNAVESMVGEVNEHLANVDLSSSGRVSPRDQKRETVVNLLLGEHGDDKRNISPPDLF